MAMGAEPTSRAEEYAYLRGDPVGALQQIRGELRTALDLGMVNESPRVATVLLEGLLEKAELGLSDV